MKKITVVGSMNVDYMIDTLQLPLPGETLFGKSFEMMPGGKGMNQAICCAKLGNEVHMIGCVGNDDNGHFLLRQFSENHMDVDGVHMSASPTGCAFVATSPDDNSIIVIKGANDDVTTSIIDEHQAMILNSDLVICQFEIPMDTVCYLIDLCDQHKIPILVNPAPAHTLPKEYVDKVTYLTPNEREYHFLYQQDKEEAMAANPKKLIMTAGGDGVYAHDGNTLLHVPAQKIQVVDTTGAGDAFNGAFGSAIVNGASFEEALAYGNRIAALTTMCRGAQSAMPKQEDIGK